MRRLFDLRLWLYCAAIAIPIFCAPDLISYFTGHLSLDKLRVFLTVGAAGGMLAGLIAQAVLIWAGLCRSRQSADQAADYDDEPPRR